LSIDIVQADQVQRLGRAHAHAGRAVSVEVAEVALHGDSAHARHPVEQRTHFRRHRRRGGRFRRVDVGRNIQRTAAGKLNRAKRTGNRAELAANAEALIELHRAILTVDGVHRADTGAGRIFTVVALLRRRFMLAAHDAQARHRLQSIRAVRLGAGRLAGVAANTERRVGNYKTVHQSILR